jgi:hypothetical protein
MKMVAFRANDAEETEIAEYMEAKHLRSLPELSRSALFAYIRQNKPGGHRSVKHKGKQGEIDPDAGGRYPPLSVAGVEANS